MNRPEPPEPEAERQAIRIDDKRHWARGESGVDSQEPGEDEAAELRAPTDTEATEEIPPEPSAAETEALRERAAAAERKLVEIQTAYQTWRTEQEQVRARLERDVERKVALRFGELAVDVLGVVDDLDLAIEHARGVEEARPLVQGVAMARDRFLQTIARLGVDRYELDGAEFDPNFAEAVAVIPAESPEAAGRVVKTVRPGYRLGDRVIRPAHVVVAGSPA